MKELLEIRNLNLTLFFIKAYLKSFVFLFLLNAMISTPEIVKQTIFWIYLALLMIQNSGGGLCQEAFCYAHPWKYAKMIPP